MRVGVIIDGTGRDGVGSTDLSASGLVLCQTLIRALPVTGGSISVVGESGQHSTVAASDRLAAELEAWQFELGEGPHWDALRTEQPVLMPDLDKTANQGTWPSLLARLELSGASGLFAFPLHLGAAIIGVADLYSRSPSIPWPDGTVQLAQDLADSVAAPAVRLATHSAAADVSHTGQLAVELRREEHQATGMVMVQLDCSASDALIRMRGEAFASGVPLDALARLVIQRRINFADL